MRRSLCLGMHTCCLVAVVTTSVGSAALDIAAAKRSPVLWAVRWARALWAVVVSWKAVGRRMVWCRDDDVVLQPFSLWPRY